MNYKHPVCTCCKEGHHVISGVGAGRDYMTCKCSRKKCYLCMKCIIHCGCKQEIEHLRQSLAALEAKLKDEKDDHDSLKHILSALEIMMRDEVALLSKEDPDFADGSIASTLTALMTYTRRITSDNSRLTLELEAARAKAREFAVYCFKGGYIGRGGWLEVITEQECGHPHWENAAKYLHSVGMLERHEQAEGWYRWLPLPAADEIGGGE